LQKKSKREYVYLSSAHVVFILSREMMRGEERERERERE